MWSSTRSRCRWPSGSPIRGHVTGCAPPTRSSRKTPCGAAALLRPEGASLLAHRGLADHLRGRDGEGRRRRDRGPSPRCLRTGPPPPLLTRTLGRPRPARKAGRSRAETRGLGEPSSWASRARTRRAEQPVRVDPRSFRPAEVELLIGDATKAKTTLVWEPTVTFEGLVDMMTRANLDLAAAGKGGRKG